MVRASCLRGLGSILVLFLSACGSKEPAPASPSPPAPPASSAPEAPAASSEPVPSAERQEQEKEKKRRPYEVTNACADVVTIVFGEDPKSASAGKRTIAPSSSVEGVRSADGTQTVWLLDTNGEPLVKVNVTRGMKRVEVGRSCRTLDAR